MVVGRILSPMQFRYSHFYSRRISGTVDFKIEAVMCFDSFEETEKIDLDVSLGVI